MVSDENMSPSTWPVLESPVVAMKERTSLWIYFMCWPYLLWVESFYPTSVGDFSCRSLWSHLCWQRFACIIANVGAIATVRAFYLGIFMDTTANGALSLWGWLRIFALRGTLSPWGGLRGVLYVESLVGNGSWGGRHQPNVSASLPWYLASTVAFPFSFTNPHFIWHRYFGTTSPFSIVLN